MPRITLQIVYVVAIIVIGCVKGAACTCENPRTPAQEFETVDAVFSGNVVKMTELKTEQGLIEGYLVKFSVEKSWKLIDRREVIIFTAGVGMCGFPFDVGETYLVYAIRGNRKELTTGVCYKTAKLKFVQKELKDLENRERLKVSKR